MRKTVEMCSRRWVRAIRILLAFTVACGAFGAAPANSPRAETPVIAGGDGTLRPKGSLVIIGG